MKYLNFKVDVTCAPRRFFKQGATDFKRITNPSESYSESNSFSSLSNADTLFKEEDVLIMTPGQPHDPFITRIEKNKEKKERVFIF